MKEAGERFDLIETPLSPGRTLIEASAGTGKTYTIAGIVLRLVLEQGFEIREILVTTYTELATAELRDRIRNLLREALAAFEGGKATSDLIERLRVRFAADPLATRRLRHALYAFDEAAIYTIHGFCQRMLKDRAFESGALFDAELVVDQGPILREIVDDFWRTQFYVGDSLLVAAAAANKVTPETLLAELDDLVNKPTAEIIPTFAGGIEAARAELNAIWEKARLCWQEEEGKFRQVFERPAWAKKPFNLSEQVEFQLAGFSRIWSTADTRERSEAISFFSASAINGGTRAGHTAPSHPLFDHCEEFLRAEAHLVLRLRSAFLNWARAEMKRRKLQRNVLSFDDLLSRLNDSLGEKSGAALARGIRQRYRAALIDEFQDTDPVQYSIFDRIYSGSDAIVFFIGDPKQAIYGFRGADVFTYISAARAATRRFSLPKNWRSETGMVAAVNALFALRQDAFVLDGISFQPVEPAGLIDREPLTLGSDSTKPLQVWLVDDEMTNTEADLLLPHCVASEIAHLLQSGARIAARRVEPPDLAVLVTTNDEARMVQEALLLRKIPAVIYSAANVFQSREVRELDIILAAVVEPGHERRVRAALATEMLGLTSIELASLEGDERSWENRLLQFQHYHEIWQERGFIQMLRALLLEQGVRKRLLGYKDGERRLTNVLHLAELLHRMCVESRLGMIGLLKQLRATIAAAVHSFQNEEHELRLERDDAAVRILTVHKSKGLEYEIVFCPFSWNNPWKRQASDVIFHRDDRLVIDLECSAESLATEEREKLADAVRLLYVALTRAKHRAYLIWGNFKKGQKSAPAHLLGQWKECGPAAIENVSSIGTSKLPTENVEVYEAPVKPGVSLRARIFSRTLDRSYGISSFTRLITGQEKEPLAPEYDVAEPTDADVAVEPEKPLQGIFAFPRGTGPGTCLHHILEEIDFSDRASIPSIVERKLKAFGLAAQKQVIDEAVGKVLDVDLRSDRDCFKLSQIGKADRLPELEFYFPIDDLGSEELGRVLGNRRLSFQRMRGFMKGFIDLVFTYHSRFYIIDWKSNWLGPNLESYNQTALSDEMESRFYNLQLAIYTVAVHRFLNARLESYKYEKHFGGVFYVFLRGVEPARPEFGIHYVRPEGKFVRQLSEVLSHGR